MLTIYWMLHVMVTVDTEPLPTALDADRTHFLKICHALSVEIWNRRQFYLQEGTFLDFQRDYNSVIVKTGAPCVPDKWMMMPTMAEPLANAFQTPVFFYSQHYSQTTFPHFCAPNNNPPIIIAFIRSISHFVVVQFKNPMVFPALRPLVNWRQSAIPEALAWEQRYTRCFEMNELSSGTSK